MDFVSRTPHSGVTGLVAFSTPRRGRSIPREKFSPRLGKPDERPALVHPQEPAFDRQLQPRRYIRLACHPAGQERAVDLLDMDATS